MIRRMRELLSKTQQHRLIGLFFMMLFGAIIESLSIALILPLVTAISHGLDESVWYARLISIVFGVHEQRAYIACMLIILIILFFLKNMYIMVERYIQFGFIASSRFNLQRKLMYRFANKEYEYFLQANSGEIVRIVSSDATQTWNYITSIMTIGTEGLICMALSITLIVMNPFMSAVFIVLMLLEILALTKIIRPVMSRLGRTHRRSTATANKWLLAMMNGIKSIKVSNTGEYFEKKYSAYAGDSVNAQRKEQTLSSFPKVFNEAFTVCMVLLVILLMVLHGYPLEDLVPILSAFAVAAMKLLPSVTTISANLNAIRYSEGAVDNIIAILNEEKHEKKEALTHEVYKPEVPITLKRSIRLENITYSYPNAQHPVLKDAFLEIKCGESVGIVGTSGAGKTTTVDILLGLLQPQAGHIYSDDTDIAFNIRGWLKHVAYIPQQIFLMDDTIRRNIAFGLEDQEISDEKVWNAIREAQLEEYVQQLPDGIDTGVGERGIRLSGGQCQRIGIARALYNDPELLIFDEATSSLDYETEKAIMAAIDDLKGRKTMIIIAHRLTTIEKCEKTYRVKDGKITRER